MLAKYSSGAEGMEQAIDEADLKVWLAREGSSESQEHFLYRTTSTFNSAFKIGRVIKSVSNLNL